MWKTNNFLNDAKSKKRRLELSCSKKLSALLREITSKHGGNFYCLNCLHYFRTESKLKSYKKVHKSKDFCDVVMLSQKYILQVNIWTQTKGDTIFMLTLNL